jgi:pimeloyl-ACP methyl ester carboxylesterase
MSSELPSSELPRPKSLPVNPSFEVQRQLLFRPESNPTDHLPFEHADRHRFDPAPAAVSPVNAWHLADASWLAYSHDDELVRAVLRDRAGLPIFEPLVGGGTSGYLAAGDTFAIVAFRGTQPDDWRDVFGNLRALAVPFDVGHVHQGFGAAFAAIEAPLDAALARLSADLPVWFTGHSLGGAIATLAAWRHRARAGGIVTMGSPLVGTRSFCDAFDEAFGARSLRFVNDRDTVPTVPQAFLAALQGGYAHVANLRAIDRGGVIGATAPASTSGGSLLELLGALPAGLPTGFEVRLPDALADHTPLYYVIHCWNDFVAHLS